MIRLRALLTMTAFFAAAAVAWLLTIELWCRGGGNPGSASSAHVAKRSAGAATASRRSRGVDSRPSGSTRRTTASESRVSLIDDSVAGWAVGRVVTRGGHEPVPEARVRLGFLDEAGGWFHVSDASDEEGRFRLPIRTGASASVSLDVESLGHCGHRSVNVPAPFSGVRDLGDVELAEFRTLWFLITSADGTPVEGAIVRSEPDEKGIEETEADGTGSIELDPGPRTLRVMASGFEIMEVPVPAFDDSVTVKLSAAASLTVRVTTPVGCPDPDTTMVRIESDRGPCEVNPRDSVWKLIGNSVPDRALPGFLAFEKTSMVGLSSVIPGLAITVIAKERMAVSETRAVVTLAPGERRVLDLVLRGEFRRLRGRVIGDGGRSIGRAIVEVGKGLLTRTTGDRGEFDFGAIPDAAIDLQVSSPGHGCWRRMGMQLPDQGSPLVVRLDAGEAVKVEVVDADGRPVAGASVYALDRHGMTGSEGSVILQHLPRDAFPVEAFYGVRGAAERSFASPAVIVRVDGLTR